MSPPGAGRRVLVASRLPGGVIDEIAGMLAAELRDTGAGVVLSQRSDDGHDERVDLVVLVGQGPEFGDLGWLPAPVAGRGTPRVVFWGLDPLPPPDLPADVVRRQLRVARARARVGATGRERPRVLSLVPGVVRRTARRAVAGPAAFSAGAFQSEITNFDARAFFRLHWILEQVDRGRIHHVVGTNRAVVKTLAVHGIDATRLPVGYHPSMGQDEHRPRDLDVVFLGTAGSQRPERAAGLRRLRDDLEASGIALTVVEDGYFGARRASLLNRAKAVVNLRSNSWHPELVRFVLAAACGAAVVADSRGLDTDPFVPARHFAEADAGDVAERVAEVVLDEARRSELASAASELLRSELTMTRVAIAMLELASA